MKRGKFILISVLIILSLITLLVAQSDDSQSGYGKKKIIECNSNADCPEGMLCVFGDIISSTEKPNLEAIKNPLIFADKLSRAGRDLSTNLIQYKLPQTPLASIFLTTQIAQASFGQLVAKAETIPTSKDSVILLYFYDNKNPWTEQTIQSNQMNPIIEEMRQRGYDIRRIDLTGYYINPNIRKIADDYKVKHENIPEFIYILVDENGKIKTILKRISGLSTEIEKYYRKYLREVSAELPPEKTLPEPVEFPDEEPSLVPVEPVKEEPELLPDIEAKPVKKGKCIDKDKIGDAILIPSEIPEPEPPEEPPKPEPEPEPEPPKEPPKPEPEPEPEPPEEPPKSEPPKEEQPPSIPTYQYPPLRRRILKGNLLGFIPVEGAEVTFTIDIWTWKKLLKDPKLLTKQEFFNELKKAAKQITFRTLVNLKREKVVEAFDSTFNSLISGNYVNYDVITLYQSDADIFTRILNRVMPPSQEKLPENTLIIFSVDYNGNPSINIGGRNIIIQDPKEKELINKFLNGAQLSKARPDDIPIDNIYAVYVASHKAYQERLKKQIYNY